jgi:hypothetical protein
MKYMRELPALGKIDRGHHAAATGIEIPSPSAA